MADGVKKVTTQRFFALPSTISKFSDSTNPCMKKEYDGGEKRGGDETGKKGRTERKII